LQGLLRSAHARSIWLGFGLVAALVTLAALAGPARATPVFLSAIDMSDPGRDAFEPEVAEDTAGNVLMVWTRSDGTNTRIQARFRAADGTLAATQTISDPGRDASEPQVAFDPSGNAIAVWNRSDGTNTRIEYAVRPAAGSFGAPQVISAAGQNASRPQISIDDSGDAVAVWERSDGANLRIEAAVRPSGGSFGAVQVLSDAGADAFKPRVAAGPAVDANAVAIWTRSDGTKLRVQSARRKDVIGYPRPKGATPFRASLVPAFQQCTSGNRTHGAPLAFPSCAPPAQSSSVLTIGSPDSNGFGANSSGAVIVTALAGNSSNNVDDADAKLTMSLTDVRNRPSGTDYTGRLAVSANIQITDRYNAPEFPETGTVQSFELQVPADCVGTANTAIGSTCSLSTTVDAVIPGAIVETQRSIWELGQIVVRDAGPNGTGYASCPPTCGDGDEAAFMKQGVFVP
jgi:hypothetical protein